MNHRAESKTVRDIFQLQISEKSGRGVSKIIEAYGKEALDFRQNSIVATIPFKEAEGTLDGISNKIAEIC